MQRFQHPRSTSSFCFDKLKLMMRWRWWWRRRGGGKQGYVSMVWTWSGEYRESSLSWRSHDWSSRWAVRVWKIRNFQISRNWAILARKIHLTQVVQGEKADSSGSSWGSLIPSQFWRNRQNFSFLDTLTTDKPVERGVLSLRAHQNQWDHERVEISGPIAILKIVKFKVSGSRRFRSRSATC